MKFLWIASKKEFNLISKKLVVTDQTGTIHYQIRE
jgi:hypothetical protein